MKEKKNQKKNRDFEMKELQTLHTKFESQIKNHITNLQIAQQPTLLEGQELRQSEELFRTTFNHAAIGIAHVDLNSGRWIRVNKRFCEIAGWSEKELLQQTFLDTTHPDDHEVDLKLIDRILQGKVPFISMEKRYVRKDGSNHWVYAIASVIRDLSGKPKYGIAIVQDIHEKKKTEDGLKLLAALSSDLSKFLECEEILSAAVKILVPEFADGCIIDLMRDDNTFHRAKVAFVKSVEKKLVEELYKYPPVLGSKSLISKAVRSAKPILVKEVDPQKTSDYVTDDHHLKVLLAIKQKSFMAVPLVARGKVIGVISFRLTSVSRQYSELDMKFAEQIASRIALALDNTNLYTQARQAVKVRDEFLSIASHELKTSLTVVKALGQVLQTENKKNGNSSSLKFLRQMDTQLDRATNLIDDLFDVSRIQSGRITFLKNLFDINLVVKESVETCQRFSTDHKIIFKSTLNEQFYGDKDRIHQVVTNLVTNAMKYSLENKKIIVRLVKRKENIVISVQDHGIGIEEDKLPRIFKQFFRADNDMKNKTVGMGLGLYIAQQIVQHHNGEIRVKSTAGKGSTFSIVLPSNYKEYMKTTSSVKLLREQS